MDILEYAMKMEKDGEAYYREQAGKVKDRNAARFLGFLVREEQKHYEIIRSYRQGVTEELDSSFIENVKTLFEEMRQQGEAFREGDGGTLAVLNHGLELEDRSIRFYVEKMTETSDAKLRDILYFLKRQEDRHYGMLSSLIDYYLKPQLWTEQAEFTHLEDY